MSPERTKTEIPLPLRIDPMLPKETRWPPLTKGWLVEIKWNGIRAVIYLEKRTQNPQIRTKTHKDISHAFPEITPGFVNLAQRHSLVLDGEIIYGEGRTKGEMNVVNGRAQRGPFSAREGAAKLPCHLVAFDLLYLDGQDLTGLPLRKRKTRLNRLISKDFQGDFNISPTAFMEAKNLRTAESGNPDLFGQLGLYEGLVFKRKSGTYVPGLTRDWLKFKFHKKLA